MTRASLSADLGKPKRHPEILMDACQQMTRLDIEVAKHAPGSNVERIV